MPFARAAADTFLKLAKPGAYTVAGGEPVTLPAGVVAQRDLLRTAGPFDAQVIGRRTEIGLLKADLTALEITPKRGDVVVVASAEYRIESPVSDDGYIVNLLVK
jgi:hypothetical protein